MEKSISDLLDGAFSGSSNLSFPEDEDLDFEDLDFKEGVSQDKTSVKQEDAAPLLEMFSLSQNKQEVLNAKSSSQEKNSSPDEGTEATIQNECGNFIDPIQCRIENEFCIMEESQSHNDPRNNIYSTAVECKGNVGNKSKPYSNEDRFSANNIEDVQVKERLEGGTNEERQTKHKGEIEPKAADLEIVHSTTDTEQVYAIGHDVEQKDKTQGRKQGERREEEGYFCLIQGHEGDMVIQDNSSEEDFQIEPIKTTFFQVEYTLEYPEITYDHIEELNEDNNKMEDFSGELHQEAGESLADYPSDFSSCEYDDGKITEPSSDFEQREKKTTEKGFVDSEAFDHCTGESSEFCSRDALLKVFEKNECLELGERQVGHSWSEVEDVFSKWRIANDDTQRTYITDSTRSCQSESREPDISMLNEDEGLVKEGVQTTASLSCGSLKEGFSLNDKAGVYGAIEEEEGGDEEEERRQEQQRIQAFYRYYDDQDGDGNKRERQRKVQFCVEALSQVIPYDTHRSREISSSSSEEEDCEEEECDEEECDEEECEEEQCETEECEEGTDQTDTELHSSMDSDEAEFHEDLTQTEAPPRTPGEVTESTFCNTNHTFLFVLKLMLSLLLALMLGLIIIWWVSDAEERLHSEL